MTTAVKAFILLKTLHSSSIVVLVERKQKNVCKHYASFSLKFKLITNFQKLVSHITCSDHLFSLNTLTVKIFSAKLLSMLF